MNKYYNLRRDLISVLEAQKATARAGKLLYTLSLALVAIMISVLCIMSLDHTMFTISNDYEYIWEISGLAFLGGVTLGGTALTTFNPVMLVFYICAFAAVAAAVVYFILNIVHASRAEFGEELILSGKIYKTFKLIIGGCLSADAVILLLFEQVFNLTKTAEGMALMEEFSVNFSFNKYPSAAAVLLMTGTFFTGAYFLCSAVKDTGIWKEYQGVFYLIGLVALLLYFWQYGYLHMLFGIDPASSSFPYPFPKAINSYNNFTGGVKGTYNSVFGSLISIFFTSSTDVFNDSIAYNSLTTLSGMIAGYILGGITGYAVAVLASCSEKWGKGVLVVCTILVSFPVAALGPVVNHWFPSNSYLMSWMAKLIVVTILCMAGMSVNAYRGLTVMKPFMMDLMTVNNASSKTVLLKLRIPNSLPNVFTALKTNSATALMGAFVCEFYSLSKTFGIGMMFNNYWDSARYQAWAYIIMAIVFGLVLYIIVAAVEKRVLSWYALSKK